MEQTTVTTPTPPSRWEVLLERMKEPSSWAGIAVLLTLFGVQLDLGRFVDGMAGLAAILTIVLREKR